MIGMILSLIALGVFALISVSMTVRWVVNKIKAKRSLRNISRVLVSDLKKLARNCTNTTTLDQLDDLVDRGYTHIMADLNDRNEIVGDMDIIRDTNYSKEDSIDYRLDDDGMLVICV